MSTIAEIDRVLSGIEKQREAERKAVDDKYDADIAALKRTRELLGKTGISATSGPLTPWPGLRAAIRQIIAGLQMKFTLDDVLAGLGGFSGVTADRSNVSSELWRMTKAKEIERLGDGRPVTYKKVVKEENQ